MEAALAGGGFVSPATGRRVLSARLVPNRALAALLRRSESALPPPPHLSAASDRTRFRAFWVPPPAERACVHALKRRAARRYA